MPYSDLDVTTAKINYRYRAVKSNMCKDMVRIGVSQYSD